jgi:nucleotide-binding universal stress UspA family protein
MNPNQESVNAALTGPILWSVDIAQISKEQISQAEAFLVSLLGNQKLPVKLIYVENKRDLIALAESEENEIKKQRANGLEKIKSLLKGSKLNIQTPIEELAVTNANTEDEVQAIIKAAKASAAALIVVGNHDDSWFKHLFKGSFSETLIARSPTPVLVVGSHAQPNSAINKILVPTEFTEDDHKVFLEAVEFARTLEASIVLFYGMY